MGKITEDVFIWVGLYDEIRILYALLYINRVVKYLWTS